MIGRWNMEAAMSKQGTRETPVVICYEGIFIRDHWMELTSCPWWYQFDPDVEHQLAWRQQVVEQISQDWTVLAASKSESERASQRMEMRADGVYLVDDRRATATKLVQPTISGWNQTGEVQSHHPVSLPNTTEELDQLIPEPAAQELSIFRSEGRDALARRVLDTYQDRLYPIAHCSSPLWGCYDLWGFEGMMLRIAEAPDLVRYACNRLLRLQLHQVAKAALLGARGIWIEECLTDMISPTVFQELNVSLVQELADAIRAAGMQSIYYFCGNPKGKLSQILSCGTDAVSFEESKKGFVVDLEEIIEVIDGRCTVFGNVDAIGVLEQGSEEELQHEIKRQIGLGQRNAGRFILSLGSPVTPGTSVERVKRYCELAHDFAARG